jgi:ribosomal protein S18 acetylase RimI-like enzyme
MRYRLLRTTDRDQRWLDQLRRSVYRELFLETFGSWDEALHVQQASECWDRGYISVIEVAGERVGMVQMFDRDGFVEVGELQIDPEHQERGIGGRVLSDVVEQAHKRGKTVTASIMRENGRALGFLQRYGFELAEQTETHHRLQYEPPG